MFGWFVKKKEVEGIKEETKKGFEFVKKDILLISDWVKHLDSEKKIQKREIEDLKEILSSVKEELDEMKNLVSVIGEFKTGKTHKRVFNKQTAVYAVQTGVQTGVQTPNLAQFSITERAILWILLNTEMKLSYDDLATMMGKEKSTIRGQINTIKQKSEGLIEESTEKSGKKRIFIPEHIKEKMLKKTKVRVKNNNKER